MFVASIFIKTVLCICNILGKPNAASRTVLMNIDALYLTPPVVTSKSQFFKFVLNGNVPNLHELAPRRLFGSVA